MSKALQLKIDAGGQIDRGNEQVFRGRTDNDDLVFLHVATAEWHSLLTAQSDRARAHQALEMLSPDAEWSRNDAGDGWTVRLALPMASV